MRRILTLLILIVLGTIAIMAIWISATPITSNPLSPSPTPTQKIVQNSPTSSPTQTPAKVSEVKIYLIAINDNGKIGEKIGCGDSVVSIVRKISPTTMPLTAAINELLAQKTQYYGQSGLYNALYQSDLKLVSAVVKDGVATVYISGQMKLGGVCDDPRVEAQLTKTVTQFSTVKKADIFIDGKSLKEVLSLK